ncbi:MAG: helix-turn-helix domain-containing protein [Candidatus Marinimicrobia bacterium]|jgi:excisionase family DNA binding protein|nr:helix-turn-helix domain-containing protein [Candidatus Neomarinimicrobiota bacterium]|tara:strand:- start:1205 stop:1483 length:279 start_codon:yes stop_codon:yes gene_type:complete
MEEGIGQPSSSRLNNIKSGIRNMEELFTKKDAAAYLKVSTRTIDRLIGRLDIPVFQVGRQIRIPESSLNMLMTRTYTSGNKRTDIIKKIYGE